MGTRADFYVGIGPNAKWVGSIAHDGYPEGWPALAIASKSEDEFAMAVGKILDEPDSTPTRPDEGWPWPWENSLTTCYAYAWCEERKLVLASRFGRQWAPVGEKSGVRMTDEDVPDMSKGKRADVIAKSGVVFLIAREEVE